MEGVLFTKHNYFGDLDPISTINEVSSYDTKLRISILLLELLLSFNIGQAIVVLMLFLQ